MTNLPLELDHVGLAIKDLEVGRQAYDKLGFTLTSRSIHQGSREPGGPVEPFGSGNHCAMFEKGYFEVMGLTTRTAQLGPRDAGEIRRCAYRRLGSGEARMRIMSLAAPQRCAAGPPIRT